MTNTCKKLGVAVGTFTVAMVAWAAVAYAQTAPTATDVATGTATPLRDQWLPAMIAAIPILITVLVARRIFRWVVGNG